MKVPILVPNIFDHPFTYESGKLNLKLGEYVIIPFGKSKLTGVVWDEFEKENKKEFLIKNVISKLNISPLNKNTISFLNWFSKYNLIPKGMALKLSLLSGEAIEDVDIKNFEKFETNFKENFFDLTANSIKEYPPNNATNKSMYIPLEGSRAKV